MGIIASVLDCFDELPYGPVPTLLVNDFDLKRMEPQSVYRKRNLRCGNTWRPIAMTFFHARPSVYTEAIAWFALAAASGIVLWIGARTAFHMGSGAAFRED